MNGKNCVFLCLIGLISHFVLAQETILCPLQSDMVKIDDANNNPTISYNTDETISLTFPDQYITDIFANYSIYDFYQTFPESNGVLLKYYTIRHGNKDLINEIYESVPQDVIHIENDYPSAPINNAIISLVDGKTFRVIKTCSNNPEVGQYCPSTEVVVPESLDITITFSYDDLNDLLTIETADTTSPCGNFFSADYKGLQNGLQLWYSNPGVTSASYSTQTCHSFEEKLYQVLGVECSGFNIGGLAIYSEVDTGHLVLERETAVFSSDLLVLEEYNLSIAENHLEEIDLFEIKGNPYLQVRNLNDQSLKVCVYNTAGKQIITADHLEENSFNISNLSTGLYFIQLINLDNQQKIFKFLKN